MSPQLVAALANIAAAQARIEGMKAENIERQEQGHALAYDGDAFFEAAQQLDVLAVHINNLPG